MEELYNQLINYFNKKNFQQFHLTENNTKEYYMFTICLKPLSRYKLTFRYSVKNNILTYAYYNTHYTAPNFYGIYSIKEVYSLLDETIGPIGCSEFKILKNCKLL